MTIINSSETSSNALALSFKVVFDETGTAKNIDDDLINSQVAATFAARKMFLKEAYAKQEVSFEAPASGLDINDIIIVSAPEFKIPNNLIKNRFIIKEITTRLSGALALDIIKAVRYD